MRINILAEVRLVQHDHRSGTAFPGKCEVPLYPADTEIVIQGRDNEDGLHIDRQDLFRRSIPRHLSREHGFSFLQRLDDRPTVGFRSNVFDGIPYFGKIRGSVRYE